MAKTKHKTNRWHPAFYAGIQIEFREDAEDLEFIQEHTLGNEPVRMDLLIIRKTGDTPLRKNIGKIFRKYNVIEYKSPDDTLSIDDFYKALGEAVQLTVFFRITGSIKMIRCTEPLWTLS